MVTDIWGYRKDVATADFELMKEMAIAEHHRENRDIDLDYTFTKDVNIFDESITVSTLL